LAEKFAPHGGCREQLIREVEKRRGVHNRALGEPAAQPPPDRLTGGAAKLRSPLRAVPPFEHCGAVAGVGEVRVVVAPFARDLQPDELGARPRLLRVAARERIGVIVEPVGVGEPRRVFVRPREDRRQQFRFRAHREFRLVGRGRAALRRKARRRNTDREIACVAYSTQNASVAP